MPQAKIFVDYQNADGQGRVRLNCAGTLEDLAQQQVHLRDGLALTLYEDDADEAGNPHELQVEGVVAYAPEERCWVATIDWDAIRRVPVSDVPSSRESSPAPPVPTGSAAPLPQSR